MISDVEPGFALDLQSKYANICVLNIARIIV